MRPKKIDIIISRCQQRWPAASNNDARGVPYCTVLAARRAILWPTHTDEEHCYYIDLPLLYRSMQYLTKLRYPLTNQVDPFNLRSQIYLSDGSKWIRLLPNPPLLSDRKNSMSVRAEPNQIRRVFFCAGLQQVGGSLKTLDIQQIYGRSGLVESLEWTASSLILCDLQMNDFFLRVHK